MNFKQVLLVQSPKTVKREDLEYTGKILLPQDALGQIINSNHYQQSVMLFSLKNQKNLLEFAVGVESFTSDPASVVIPLWIQEQLALVENDKVQISLINPPSGTFALFQPYTEAFNKLSNPRAILEHHFRALSCLTQGTTITIVFNKKEYKLKVLKVEPKPCVSIINADLETDFATPRSLYTHNWGEEEESYEPNKVNSTPYMGKAHTLKK